VARCLIEPLSQGESLARTYSAKGIRVRTDTRGRSRFGLASQAETLRSVAFCGMPTIGKNHPDPANAPNQPARADFKRLIEQRMDRVDDPDSG